MEDQPLPTTKELPKNRGFVKRARKAGSSCWTSYWAWNERCDIRWREWVLKYCRRLIWPVIVILCLTLVASVVLTVMVLLSPSVGFEPSNPDYALYKNTLFRNCSSRTPKRTNCTLIEHPNTKFGEEAAEYGMFFLNSLSYYQDPDQMLGTKYSWCELSSCLKDFKVIPSLPLGSAFGSTSFLRLTSIYGIALSAAWALKSQIRTPKHNPEDCKGFGKTTWFFNAYDFCCFSLWWYSFWKMVMDPINSSPVSIMAWVTILRHTYDTQHHPVSCWIAPRPRWKRPLVWAFILATAAQLAATSYVVYAQWDVLIDTFRADFNRRYDCLESRIANAPGQSHCSIKQLCTKDWLFSAPMSYDLTNNVIRRTGLQYYVSIFFMALIYLLLPFPCAFVYLIWRALRDRGRVDKRKVTKTLLHLLRDWQPAIALVTVGVGTTAFLIAELLAFAAKWQSRGNGEAVVAYDLECRALHVALSPWKFYYDVNVYGRDWRIVKAWFGA